MKNVLKVLLLILLVAPLLTGCGEEKRVYKTEYEINEVAIIDHYEVIYKGYTATKNEIHIDFAIKNNSNSAKEINLSKDFVIYTNESQKITNPYQEQIITINPDETEEFEVIVTAEELFDNTTGELTENFDTYKILFYSNVATNNIAFLF